MREAQDWLCLRIAADDAVGVQRLVAGPVRELLPTARAAGADRWFFLRWHDIAGWHLRLRLRGTLPALATVQDLAERAFAGRTVSYHVYEPEYAKYRGPDGVDRAEAVQQHTSELALELAATDYWPDRHLYATALVRLAAERLPPSERASFLYHYAWYWSGGRIAAFQRARAHGAAAIRAVRELERRPALHRTLADTAAALGQPPGRTADLDRYLLFHHLHLANNRLGVTPAQEAVAAAVLHHSLTSASHHPHPLGGPHAPQP